MFTLSVLRFVLTSNVLKFVLIIFKILVVNCNEPWAKYSRLRFNSLFTHYIIIIQNSAYFITEKSEL